MKTKGTNTKTTSTYTWKSKGIYMTPSGTYRTRITVAGTTYSKNFTTLKDAKLFYKTMKNSL